ncbi:Chorion peroxidase [Portunus trituberculatus]|uniref:Chorion peroxidase n=1 Tax=Portunus trituberculatus TaxID=210409 RepID=A0A5B7DMT9_PORTR|nr:Chorion peroxidase [Portunus trituberculatus]
MSQRKPRGAHADREGECIEVGFARTAGSMLHQGYEAAKETLLARWADEDLNGKPKYSNFSPLLKNVTRTGQLLEAASQAIIGLVRKTRVGKRCAEDWLLKGLEKHVLPLINVDKQFAEEMGLGFSSRGSVKGGKLPSARSVAEVLRKHLKRPAVTGLFGEWGHFMQRDVFSIPESPLAEDVDCCKTPEAQDCDPIQVAEDDPLHATLPCINYRRSARAQAILGHRESLSLVSTYLDATPVYGSTDKIAFQRKTGYFGYLKAPGDEDDDEEGEKKTKKEKKVGDCAAPESFAGCFHLEEDDDWVSVAGYLVWRRFCDDKHAYNTWEDLERGLDKELVKDLKELYQ